MTRTRKYRKFDGKRYELVEIGLSKRQIVAKAKLLRKLDMNARVVAKKRGPKHWGTSSKKPTWEIYTRIRGRRGRPRK